MVGEVFKQIFIITTPFLLSSRLASSASLTAGSSETASESELLELRLLTLCLDFGNFVSYKLMYSKFGRGKINEIKRCVEQPPA